MGIINKERFVDLLLAAPTRNADPYAPGLRTEVYRAINTARLRDTLNGNVDRASALMVYDQIKGYFVQNGYVFGKELRPWAIDPNLYKNLDRKQAWWGFEFETGYLSHDARG